MAEAMSEEDTAKGNGGDSDSAQGQQGSSAGSPTGQTPAVAKAKLSAAGRGLSSLLSACRDGRLGLLAGAALTALGVLGGGGAVVKSLRQPTILAAWFAPLCVSSALILLGLLLMRRPANERHAACGQSSTEGVVQRTHTRGVADSGAPPAVQAPSDRTGQAVGVARWPVALPLGISGVFFIIAGLLSTYALHEAGASIAIAAESERRLAGLVQDVAKQVESATWTPPGDALSHDDRTLMRARQAWHDTAYARRVVRDVLSRDSANANAAALMGLISGEDALTAEGARRWPEAISLWSTDESLCRRALTNQSRLTVLTPARVTSWKNWAVVNPAKIEGIRRAERVVRRAGMLALMVILLGVAVTVAGCVMGIPGR